MLNSRVRHRLTATHPADHLRGISPVSYLYQALALAVDQWRKEHYPSEDFPAIGQILAYATLDDDSGQLRFLRRAQLRALETYWYLRLVLGTPAIPELYEKLFPKPKDRREAMGLAHPEIVSFIADEGLDACLERIRTDNAFVRKHRLESLRETLSLDYPSYILALAMGAGKTILMGAIVATEFALAMHYEEREDGEGGPFVQNALIFAPGKTILSALRELADVPYDQLLPPEFHKAFAASFKLTFTRDGDKRIPVIGGSTYNLIVTNTEKIRIQKPSQRGNANQLTLAFGHKQEEAEAVANLRLQAIASLPNLAVFSDEAHHTYGQKLLGKWVKDKETGEEVFKDEGIKKVRHTIDYLHDNTDLRVVVNATGTPYFERQPLRDVVVWYGLGEGIRDGVLKELARNIKVLELGDTEAEKLVESVVLDFVSAYWTVSLPNGAPARLALYFPTIETRDELRGAIESALAQRGIGSDTLLAVDAKSPESVRRAFLATGTDPAAPHRILLLVNMGTEGWNCPSLFATALIRKLGNSNNFVLQAATRCLRQVPGNSHPARVYLTPANKKTLEDQLAETYGTSLKDLDQQHAERVEKEIVLRKPDLPPLLIKKRVLRFRRAETDLKPLALIKPEVAAPVGIRVESFSPVQTESGATRLKRVDAGDQVLPSAPPEMDLYSAAALLAADNHLPTREILAALRPVYGVGCAGGVGGAGGEVPDYHLEHLSRQIATQRADFETWFEDVDVAVALVRKEGFERREKDGKLIYTARISFAKEREALYLTAADSMDAALARELSFHYEGYNFDSGPEKAFLDRTLALLRDNAHQIEGLWFTGGLTDPGKTGLSAEYLGTDGRWHRYTPDFVLRRADGKHLIVEIKKDALSPDIESDEARHAQGKEALSAEGRKVVALKRWQALNPERLRYEVLFEKDLDRDGMVRVLDFITGGQP